VLGTDAISEETVRHCGRATTSSSSWSHDSGVPSVDPEAMAASRASFEGWRSCMVSSVLPSRSSKVTVVMAAAASPPSSLVQTRREHGATSRYLPKNSMVCEARPKTRR